MPTVLRIGPYRFFFYAGDCSEPRHVHVEWGESTAKFWLDPVRLQKSRNFSSKELTHLQKLVEENQEELRKSWEAYCEN